jgi:hypothetical protein
VLSYFRAHRAGVATIATVVAIVLQNVAADGTARVLFQPDRAAVRLALLAPLLLATAMVPTLAQALPELELTVLARIRWARRWHAAGMVGVLATASLVTIALGRPRGLEHEVARNSALLLGLLLVSSTLVEVDLAWVIPVAYTGITYLFGMDFALNEARWWAVLVMPASPETDALALGLVAAGLVAFTWRGVRT